MHNKSQDEVGFKFKLKMYCDTSLKIYPLPFKVTLMGYTYLNITLYIET